MSEGSAASAAQTSIPYKREASSDDALPGAGSLAILLLLCAVAVVILLTLKRRVPGVGRRASAIEVVESRHLGGRTQLSLVNYRGREILIAHGEHGASVIADGAGVDAQQRNM